ncbi:MAG: hypothetical protein ABIH65_04030 [Nanoarchaeota archaeon]
MKYQLTKPPVIKISKYENSLDTIACGALVFTAALPIFIGLGTLCLFSKKIRNAVKENLSDEYFPGANQSLKYDR